MYPCLIRTTESYYNAKMHQVPVTFLIKVIGKPTVTSLTGMPTELLKEGDQVTLTVAFKANGSTSHTYQWYIGNQAITNATTATLNYTFAKADHGKTIKVAIKATEFTDATEASAGVTFDGTMITDKTRHCLPVQNWIIPHSR